MCKFGVRLLGIATALVLSVGCIPVNVVSARNAAADTFEMSILTQTDRKDTVSISTLDTAEGDVVLHAGVYIDSDQWEEYDYIESASAYWTSSDYSKVHFENILNLTATNSQTVVSYSGGEYTTRYVPYCFASVVDLPDGSYEMNRPASVTVTKDAYDPIFGSEIYQVGYNQIKFTYNYYSSQIDKEADVEEGTKKRRQKRECICDVQYTADGLAFYEYSYIRQDTYELETAVGTLPMYDPLLEAGEIVPGLSNFIMWLYKGSSETSFFGESSDEFPLVTFDIVVEQGTPAGIYSVDFITNSGKTFLGGVTSKEHIPASANGMTIIVDDSAPRLTTETAMTTTTEEPIGETTETEPIFTTTVSETTEEQTTFSETTSVSVHEIDEPVATRPAIEPMFLETGTTMYVGESGCVQIHNTRNHSVVWVVDNPEIVEILAEDGEIAGITAKNPGSTDIYAVVDSNIYTYKVTVLANEEELLCGDVNRDDTIALNDLTLLMRYMVGSVQLGYYSKCNGDCNEDKKLDFTDLISLQQFLTKKLTSLPSEPV